MGTGFPRLVRQIEILHSEGEGDSIAYRKLWIAIGWRGIPEPELKIEILHSWGGILKEERKIEILHIRGERDSIKNYR